ncbi:MAG: serine/threonine protein kinase, partial [Proteobacteria bacterium]
GLAFISTAPTDLPSVVSGDERRLRQVLMNLLDNAIKYTIGGAVALRVESLESKLRFAVEDTGIGIEPEHLSEIFNLFHQVRDPAVVVEGTGLGLAISRRLTRLMGGELQVASVPGQGSRFWFDLTLPAAPHAAPTSATRTVIALTGAKRSVLVVDDEEHGRSLLRELLAPLGIQVYEARDGEAAIQEAQRLRPDAILMDIRMPRVNGLEATRRIRQIESLADTIIIAISAGAFERDRQHCIEAGANDFVAKPYRQEKLLAVVCSHLGLEPVYAEDKAPASAAVAVTLVVPPASELRTLLDLASRGDIKRFLDQLTYVEQLQPAYAPFVNQLRTRAAGYRMKELRRWLKSFEGVMDECVAR